MRDATNRILELVEEGAINTDELIHMLLMWLSEAEVKEMARANDLLLDEEEEEFIDSMDGDHESALASAGWGMDEDYAPDTEY
jgi:hypothetical protein